MIDDHEKSLRRAIEISLFTWRRADRDDKFDDESKQGWWGDSFPSRANDRIGSRLWMLRRKSITQETINLARSYTREALQWLIDDGYAHAIDVAANRTELHTVAVTVRVDKKIDIRFDDLWGLLNAI